VTSSNPTFASDNYAGVHPDIMQALVNANKGHEGSYGADQYTSRAIQKFKEFLGEDIEVFFAYNGTAANVLGLASMTKSFNSILCSELAHINVDESTAPEVFTGCKLIPLPILHGKITPSTLDEAVIRIDDQHHPQAKVISISQTTEYGTVYTKREIQAISDVARKHRLLLHMDGSRISNAAVSLGEDFKSFTKDAGVDVLSFGGTKNGMMFGEAVIFFTPGLSENFKYIRKQGMQLHSKMRFISAQFEALLSNDLWKKNAQHANAMAGKLEKEIRKYSKAVITQPVEANSIFVNFPPAVIPKLQEEHFFYVWNDKTLEARLMCAFDTTENEIENFGRKLNELLN
jgi:threonine aldolase